MRLKRLVLNNFRPFYGRYEIAIADGESTNTTLFFGNNGGGKTALLNAFTWALYDEFTPGFADPDLLINKRAASEAKEGATVSCSVEIWYEHKGEEFRLVRESKETVKAGVARSGSSRIVLYSIIGESKEQRPHAEGRDAEREVSNHLPKNLYNYFFFDGERIENIVKSDQKQQVSDATKFLIGVKTVQRSYEHLVKASTKLRQEINVTGDADLAKKIDEYDKCETKQIDQKAKLAEIEKELSNQKHLRLEINNKFELLKDSQRLIQRRKEIIDLKNDIEARVRALDRNRASIISRKGYLAFIHEPVLKFEILLDKLRQRGELPAPIKHQFVEDLLEKGSCICGSILHSGSEAYQQVSSWLLVAPMAGAEETALKMKANLDRTDDDTQEMWDNLDENSRNVDDSRIQLSKLDSELGDVNDKLRTDPSMDIQRLQQRLDETDERISKESVKRAECLRNLDQLRISIEILESEIKKQKLNEEKSLLARKRWEATKDAIDRMKDLETRMGNQFRLQLEQKIQKMFEKILTALYIPRLTPNYDLILVERTTAGRDLPVPASMGQNQVLSLSFIMSILDCMRDWKEKGALELGIDISTFPLVIDSPFGSLDELHSRQIAKSLPNFAQQLLLMVSKTQWREEISEEVMPHVGRRYILLIHTPKKDAQLNDITIGGERYPLVQKDSEFEYTEIVEI